MTLPNEIQLLEIAAGAILAANILAMILFIAFAKLPAGNLKQRIHEIIFQLDKFADDMEVTQKRSDAIRQINELLGWRRILVPGVLIGWVIDTEVTAIRKMEQATDCPDLHQDGEAK
jgi:hypothetical protein